jgi:exoribonuclease R
VLSVLRLVCKRSVVALIARLGMLQFGVFCAGCLRAQETMWRNIEGRTLTKLTNSASLRVALLNHRRMNRIRDKILYVKTKKGKIARIVREHYLRSDILCQSALCKKCPNVTSVLTDTTNETQKHYVIFGIDVILNFLEVLELSDIKNIIFLQTAVQIVQEKSHKLYQRLRTIINDGRRNAIVFPNENFEATFVERKTNETLDDRNRRAFVMAAYWWMEHLRQSVSHSERSSVVEVVLVSEDQPLLNLAKEFDIVAYSLHDYLSKYFKDNMILRDLYESLVQSVKGESGDIPTESTAPTSYEEYKPDDVLEAEVKSGTVFKGKLQVSFHNPREAFVRLEEKSSLGRDIFIPNPTLRNRAIHGDIVAVELLDRKLWRFSNSLQPQFPEEEDIEQSPTDSTINAMSSTSSSSSLSATAMSDIRPCGRVVGIFKRNWRPYVCTVQLERVTKSGVTPQTSKIEKILVVPFDFRIPLIRIQTRQYHQLINQRILVRIDSWDVKSNYPSGHYIRTLGEIGQRETEIQTLLMENEIDVKDFAPNILNDIPLPQGSTWRPPQEEYRNRRDCRHWHVFSIDPEGSQDIDDALSVTPLSNGNVLVGCRILDISVDIDTLILTDWSPIVLQ